MPYNMTTPSGTLAAPYDVTALLYTANAQNGLPGLHNDTGFGQSRYLQTVSNPFSSAFTHLTPFSVAIAFRREIINNLTEALIHQMVNHNAYYYQGWGIFLNFFYGLGAASLWIGNTFAGVSASQILVRGSTVLTNGTGYVLIVNYDGSGTAAGVSMYLNGVAETMTVVGDSLVTGTIPDTTGFTASVTGGTVATTAPLSIGDSWNGGSANSDYFFEWILLDRQMTSLEATNCSSYLNSKWALY